MLSIVTLRLTASVSLPVASRSATRSVIGPSDSLVVSNDSVRLTDVRHGTARPNS